MAGNVGAVLADVFEVLCVVEVPPLTVGSTLIVGWTVIIGCTLIIAVFMAIWLM
jgi:hypothetical protein